MISVDWISPVESHGGIFFKRDDLFQPFANGVNGGKARQAIALIESNLDHIRRNCDNTVITTTNVDSPQGIIVSTVCEHFGIRCIVAFGYVGGDKAKLMRKSLVAAIEKAGGEVQIVANAPYPNVVDSAVRRLVDKHGWFYVKFGINVENHSEAILGTISNQVQNLPDVHTLVVPVGSGLTFSAIVQGLEQWGKQVNKVIGVLCGYDCRDTVRKLIGGVAYETGSLERTGIEYQFFTQPYAYHRKLKVDSPFPLDPIYEAKAWEWMQQNGIKDDALFWVVGNQRLMYP